MMISTKLDMSGQNPIEVQESRAKISDNQDRSLAEKGNYILWYIKHGKKKNFQYLTLTALGPNIFGSTRMHLRHGV